MVIITSLTDSFQEYLHVYYVHDVYTVHAHVHVHAKLLMIKAIVSHVHV